MAKKKFDSNTATLDEWITHLEARIPALSGCKTHSQRIDVVNGHRGMLQGNSRLAQETYRFLTKICKLNHLQVTPART